MKTNSNSNQWLLGKTEKTNKKQRQAEFYEIEPLSNDQSNIQPWEDEDRCNQVPESAFDANTKMKNLKGMKSHR